MGLDAEMDTLIQDERASCAERDKKGCGPLTGAVCWGRSSA